MPRRDLALSLLLIGAAILGSAGCKSGGGGAAASGGAGASNPADSGVGGAGGEGSTVFSRAELLAAFGSCAATSARDFRERAAILESATAELATTSGDAARAAAREAFHAAMDAWQVMENLQFGPTASRATLGGQDFRDNIYAWPLFGRCAIEEEIVSGRYTSADFATVLLANRRGLGALEYLLFYEGADTACAPSSSAYAGWTALTADERDARRRAYAAAAARDVVAHARNLDQAWDPAGGDFAAKLRNAGSGSAVYASTQAALNSISDALFYIENQTKDMKLLLPLSLEMDKVLCEATSCPELFESQFAGRSKMNIRFNLDGARRLLEGCGPSHAGLGFDDLLVALGAEELAAHLRTQAIAVETALDAIPPGDLKVIVLENRAPLDALYAAVKSLTALLKSEFVTILDLKAPADTLGDND